MRLGNQNGLPTSFSDPPDVPACATGADQSTGDKPPRIPFPRAPGNDAQRAEVVLSDGTLPIRFDAAVDATAVSLSCAKVRAVVGTDACLLFGPRCPFKLVESASSKGSLVFLPLVRPVLAIQVEPIR
jgi:hypothetical protein